MTDVWDVHRAELYDTIRSDKKARPLRPCVYCGMKTRALSQVCCAHSDLVERDYGYPSETDSALEDADVRASGPDPFPPDAPSPSSASSSAESEPVSPGGSTHAARGPAAGDPAEASGLALDLASGKSTRRSIARSTGQDSAKAGATRLTERSDARPPMAGACLLPMEPR